MNFIKNMFDFLLILYIFVGNNYFFLSSIPIYYWIRGTTSGKSGSGWIRIPNVWIFSIKNILLKTMFFVVIYELVIVLEKSKKKYDILIILVEFYVN